MSEGESFSDGVLASARRLGSSLLGLFRSRIELFAVELQEEKLRTAQLLLSLAIAIALVVAALLLAIGTLALFLWRWAGYAGLVGLTVAVAAAAVGAIIGVRRRITHGPEPFSATVDEFRKDLECLRRDN